MRIFKRHLTLDGTDESGNLSGSATSGPWAIFDVNRQDWLITGIRWKWLARLYLFNAAMKGA